MLEIINRLKEMFENYESSDVISEISEKDDMFRSERGSDKSAEMYNFYMYTGKSAIGLIARAMLLNGSADVKRVLDLPCGFGRVARHLARFFPDADIYCSDLYKDRVDFCEKTFGVKGLESKEELSKSGFGVTFDLIFCGSLLTHLNEKLFRESIPFFIRHLNVGGIAIITLHGRHVVARQFTSAAFPKKYQSDFFRHGFGYFDINDPEKYSLNKEHGYGASFSSPSYVMSLVEQYPELSVIGYHERAWVGYQDVLVIRREISDMESFVVSLTSKSLGKTVIYGTGSYAQSLFNNLPPEIIPKMASFVDSDARKHGTTFNGLPVLSHEEMIRLKPDTIIIASQTFKQIIRERLANILKNGPAARILEIP